MKNLFSRSSFLQSSTLLAVLMTACVVCAPARAQTSIDVRIPSDGAGSGGTLATRLWIPDTGRCSGQAPLVVFFVGGSGGGTLEFDAVDRALLGEGIISVDFLYPGSSWIDDTGTPIASSGLYDWRGPNCLRAGRDVLRFCLGLIADEDGRYVTDHAAALTSVVGVLGSSNGGNSSMAVLGQHGAELPGVSFAVSWESPSNDQYATGTLGTQGTDPDESTDADGNGLADDDGGNPFFQAYRPHACEIDLSLLWYDAAEETELSARSYPGLAWIDGDGDHRITRTLLGYEANGRPKYDYDADDNGRIDTYEDFPLSGYEGRFPGGMKLVYPVSVRAPLETFSPGARVATLDETRVFWRTRMQVTMTPAAAAALPGLAVMAVLSQSDHVQAAHDSDGHYHVQAFADAVDAQGLWLRINPDRVYVESIADRNGGLLTDTPADNDAGPAPTPGTLHGMAEPPGIVSAWTIAAAVTEMVDRVSTDAWEAEHDNLDALLVTPP